MGAAVNDTSGQKLGSRFEKRGGAVRLVVVEVDALGVETEVAHIDYTPMQAAQVCMNLIEAMKP